MADVLGALNIASIVISMTLQLSQVYAGVNISTYQPPKKFLSELPVLVSLLDEIQKNTTNSESEPTRSVSVALEISVERFEELIKCLKKMGLDPKTGTALPGKRHKMQRFAQVIQLMNTEGLQDATKRFRSALTLLRDIAMDHRTHDLIARQREFLCLEFESIRQALRNPTVGLPNEVHPLENTHESDPEPEIDIPFERQLRFSEGQGFSLFSVTFSLELPNGERPFFYPAKAKFDTGCPDCLISEALVKRHKLERWLTNSVEERTYIGLGNVEVVSRFQLQLNWSANNERTLRTNVFYLVADSPFELLLGEYFRKANDKLLPALPIRLLHKKDKAQKQVELERKREDDRIGAELTAHRRRTKATQQLANAQLAPAAQQAAQINHDQRPQAQPSESMKGKTSSTDANRMDTGEGSVPTINQPHPQRQDEETTQENITNLRILRNEPATLPHSPLDPLAPTYLTNGHVILANSESPNRTIKNANDEPSSNHEIENHNLTNGVRGSKSIDSPHNFRNEIVNGTAESENASH